MKTIVIDFELLSEYKADQDWQLVKNTCGIQPPYRSLMRLFLFSVLSSYGGPGMGEPQGLPVS